MWVVQTDGSGMAHWRPAATPGAHQTAVNHQVVTARGIVYEAVGTGADGRRLTYFGRFDPASLDFSEGRLPLSGYCHAGFAPAGAFDFVEHAGPPHEILSVHAGAGDALEVRRLHTLRSPDHDQQRFHAHPFLSPDRTRMFFTDWDERGFAQVHSL